MSLHLIIPGTYAAATFKYTSALQALVSMTERKRGMTNQVYQHSFPLLIITSPPKKQNTHRQEQEFCRSYTDYANSLFMMYFILWYSCFFFIVVLKDIINTTVVSHFWVQTVGLFAILTVGWYELMCICLAVWVVMGSWVTDYFDIK